MYHTISETCDICYLRIVPFLKFYEVHTFQDKTPKERKKKITDHLSLWAKFQINKLTQELDQIIYLGN